MSRQYLYGLLIILAGSLQIVTSIVWKDIENVEVGEAVFYLGQDIGEFIYLAICRQFLLKYGIFKAVTEFLLSLSFYGIVEVCFLEPNKISLPKFCGFVFSIVVLLLRIKVYTKKNE